MLLSEELRKLSQDSLPLCIQENYDAVVDQLRTAARDGVTSCKVTIFESGSHLVQGVVRKIKEQGFKVEEEPLHDRTTLIITWG